MPSAGVTIQAVQYNTTASEATGHYKACRLVLWKAEDIGEDGTLPDHARHMR